jgi:hypothetical protein
MIIKCIVATECLTGGWKRWWSHLDGDLNSLFLWGPVPPQGETVHTPMWQARRATLSLETPLDYRAEQREDRSSKGVCKFLWLHSFIPCLGQSRPAAQLTCTGARVSWPRQENYLCGQDGFLCRQWVVNPFNALGTLLMHQEEDAAQG